MSFKNVVLVGADGTLGPSVYRALVQNGHHVTVFKRESSKSSSTYPSQTKIPDDFPVDVLAEALQGIDAVVVTVNGSQTAIQKRLAEACVRAGVKRFIPADFGSTDSTNPIAQDLVPLFRAKTELREYLVELATAHASFTWTSLVCGHFADLPEFLHVDIAARRADVLDDGAVRASATTLARIGAATAQLLAAPTIGVNRIVFIQSFCVSQNELVAAFERATGGAKWTVTSLNSVSYCTEQKQKADAGDHTAIEDLVWLLGSLYANWEDRPDFVNPQLGFKDEDLDAFVQQIVNESQA